MFMKNVLKTRRWLYLRPWVGSLCKHTIKKLRRKMVSDQKLYWLKIQIYCQYSLIQFLYITNNHPCCLWTLIIMWVMLIFNQQFLSKQYNFSNYFLIIGNKVAEDLTFIDSCVFNLQTKTCYTKCLSSTFLSLYIKTMGIV